MKEHTAVRIEPADLAKLAELAKTLDRSVGYLIRQAIREFLEKREKE